MVGDQAASLTLTSFDQGKSLRLPSVRVLVTLPDRRVLETQVGMSPLVFGTSSECDVVVSDPLVSRRHCEIRLTERGVLLRDLGSKNGTLIQGVPILEALLPPGVVVTVGTSQLTVRPTGTSAVLPLSASTSFGRALGQSLSMRALFAKLERAAPTDETLLLLGESGTGKELLARAVHENSRRSGGPFVVVDCGAIAPSLIEGELFGYVPGAFSGATTTKPGLLELANRGTLFIDEIGELPLDLQPKLLRALESREVRRLGAKQFQPFDARIVAATHRNLRVKATEGAFRQDLYFRLAVIEFHVPALRERRDDIPLLVERILEARDPPRALADLPPHALPLLQAYDWPGNVRELRNAVARLVLFPELLPELAGPSRTGSVTMPPVAGLRTAPPSSPGILGPASGPGILGPASGPASGPGADAPRSARPGGAPPSALPPAGGPHPDATKAAAPRDASPPGSAADPKSATDPAADHVDLDGFAEKRLGRLLDLSLPEAREVVLEELERSYVAAKLRQHGGNISRAADAMGVSRQLVHRLLERHGMRAK
ncbi:sigma 54-interacting transcriptional regulator [Chondromyces apiculatus]|uniref:Response regulator of zinc sigma-54-dependent two-component system n=1 Tax=Chondromyces apiculatus DSM 436 TaxID=1192034 RepID=A0A017SSQ2_9BACT|nr:sigma 54-interacting transcriptional regulator [Chondromyces apiculatus]EYF00008.1 Response regulator of zinc sigma-54-dependent two-component system [Chondromyces apiculatus DSM 436]